MRMIAKEFVDKNGLRYMANVPCMPSNSESYPAIDRTMKDELKALKLPTRAYHAMMNIGVLTIDEIQHVTNAELFAAGNCGKITILQLDARLLELGIKRKDAFSIDEAKRMEERATTLEKRVAHLRARAASIRSAAADA